MISGIIGKKVGMTQIIQDDGTVVPVTVIQAGPCVVVQKKTTEKDGYESVQLGFVEFVKPKRINKAMTGHFKKADAAPVRVLREIRVEGDDAPKPGDKVLCDIFTAEERAGQVAGYGTAPASTEAVVEAVVESLQQSVPVAPVALPVTPAVTTAHSSSELLEQITGKTNDAPLCMTCGIKMRPAGSCYVCEGCGSTSGCS